MTAKMTAISHIYMLTKCILAKFNRKN